MKYCQLLPIAYLSLLLCACRHKPDLEAEKQKLLALHQEQQDAHLNENTRQFVGQFAENMISVNRGKITTTTEDSALHRVQTYFENVAFKKWEDVHPPEIHFSEDATMAYMVVDKLVVTTYKDDTGAPIEETTHFAWVSIVSKQPDGQWKVVCNVSTNEPSVEKNLNPAETPVPNAYPVSQ